MFYVLFLMCMQVFPTFGAILLGCTTNFIDICVGTLCECKPNMGD